jgi:hypothetical protein
MQPANTRNATDNFIAPGNWDEEQDGTCAMLEVRVERSPREGRYPVCVSTWEPSAEDVIKILHGGHIELHVVGDQPPVMLVVVDPVYPKKVPEAKHVTINETAHGFDEHGPDQPR